MNLSKGEKNQLMKKYSPSLQQKDKRTNKQKMMWRNQDLTKPIERFDQLTSSDKLKPGEISVSLPLPAVSDL